MIVASTGQFVIAPNAGLMIWSVLMIVGIIGGAITLAKGRWGLFALGLFTGGILWVFTALAQAAPGSLWDRYCRRNRLSLPPR